MFDEDQDMYNNIQGGYHFGDYQQIVYEEQTLKANLGSKLGAEYSAERFYNLYLHPNKFDQTLM